MKLLRAISTVAAPIRDRAGHVVAALGITVTSGHIQRDTHDDLIRQVRASAAELSGLLGHKADSDAGRVVPIRGGAGAR